MSTASRPSAALEARNLTGGYQGRTIVQRVNARFASGRVAALVGPNGAGKSTLLRLLSGWLHKEFGEVLLDGRPLATYRPLERARRMAFMPQEPRLAMSLTVDEVVLLGRLPHTPWLGVPTEGDRRIVAETLAYLGLQGFAGRRLETLSGGERRQVFLAAALAQQPSVLLLDEPTANLDARHQWQVLQSCGQLAREGGLAVVVVLHDLNLAARFADDIFLMHQGALLASGTPHEVLTEDHLATAFGMRYRILEQAGGRPLLVPEGLL